MWSGARGFMQTSREDLGGLDAPEKGGGMDVPEDGGYGVDRSGGMTLGGRGGEMGGPVHSRTGPLMQGVGQVSTGPLGLNSSLVREGRVIGGVCEEMPIGIDMIFPFPVPNYIHTGDYSSERSFCMLLWRTRWGIWEHAVAATTTRLSGRRDVR